jgi:HAD superfamily hydrolase (TIGR01509 family)
MLLMKLKAVIFDLDGVLVDTEALHYRAWVEALKKFGVKFTEKEYMDYVGQGIRQIAHDLAERYGLDFDKFFSERRRLGSEIIDAEKKPRIMPFAKEALEFFRESKMKMALASGGYRDGVDTKVSRSGLAGYFGAIVSLSDVGYGKPHPDVYIEASKMLGVRPEECLAFEDTAAGVQSAKSAGMTCFAIPNRFTENQDFSIADRVFPSLKEAMAHVKRIIS